MSGQDEAIFFTSDDQAWRGPILGARVEAQRARGVCGGKRHNEGCADWCGRAATAGTGVGVVVCLV